MTIDLTPTGFDPISGVYTGSQLSSLTRVWSAYEDRYSVPVRGGETYSIAVDGISGTTGTIKLALDFAGAPDNDDFGAATELSGESASASATCSPRPPRPVSRATGTTPRGRSGIAGRRRRTVAWRWTWTAATTTPRAGATVAASLGGLTLVGRNNDNGESTASRLEWDATGGTTYRIAVDGYNGAFGDVVLKLDHAATTEPPRERPILRARRTHRPTTDPTRVSRSVRRSSRRSPRRGRARRRARVRRRGPRPRPLRSASMRSSRGRGSIRC